MVESQWGRRGADSVPLEAVGVWPLLCFIASYESNENSNSVNAFIN